MAPTAADPSPAAPDAPSLIDHLSDGNFAGVKAKMQEHAESAAAAASDLHATALDLHATHVVPGVAAMRDLHEQHIAPHAATAGAALADAHASAHRNLADLHATHVAPAVQGALDRHCAPGSCPNPVEDQRVVVSCFPGSCPNLAEDERVAPFEPGTEIRFEDSDEVHSVLIMPRQDRLLRCLRESEALLRKAKSECDRGDAQEIDFLLRMTLRVISNSVQADHTAEDEKDALFESADGAFSEETAKGTEAQAPSLAPVKGADASAARAHPPVAVSALSLLLSATVVVPSVLMMLAAVFGTAMAYSEDWSIKAGFLYFAANLTGLGSPFTHHSPTTRRGKLIEIIVSTWVIVFGSAAVCTVSNLRAIKKLRAALPLKGARGLVVILLLLPGLVIIAAAGMAVAVTKLEDGWSKPTAFRFTISAMCGLGNPLTNQVPETALGKLAALGCASLQMAIGGIFVGLISDGCLKCCCCCARPQPKAPPPKPPQQQQNHEDLAIAEEAARDVRNV